MAKSQAIFMHARKLHPTQKEISRTEEEVIFELNVRINMDLVTELCSYSDNIKIFEPKHLANKMTDIFKIRFENMAKIIDIISFLIGNFLLNL